jgi:putative membrane protein
VGEYLGLPFARSNPRKTIKRAKKPLGNLPLEILQYLSAYADEMNDNGQLKSAIIYGQISTFPFPYPLQREQEGRGES